jgi:hypothetical protein
MRAEKSFSSPVPGDHSAVKINREGWEGGAEDRGLNLLQ